MVDPGIDDLGRVEHELDERTSHASPSVKVVGELVAAGLTPERTAEAQQILRQVTERLERLRETLLPRQAPTGEAPIAAGPAPTRARILVIDDDELVARSIQRMLCHEHDVTLELSAREALDRFRAGERFDVVLCDVIMPEVSGPEFHAELLRTAPEQARRVVFVTGGAFTPDVAGYLDKAGVRRLEKPFDADELGELVAGFLEG